MPIEYNFTDSTLELIQGGDGNLLVPFGSSNNDFIRITIFQGQGAPAFLDGQKAVYYSNTIYDLENPNGLSLNPNLLITIPRRINEGQIEPYYLKQNLNDFKIYRDSTNNYFVKPNEILTKYNAIEGHYKIKIDFLNQFKYHDNQFRVTEISNTGKEIRLKLHDMLPITGDTDLVADYTNPNSLENFLFDVDGIYRYDCVLYSGVEETAIISHAIDRFTSGRDNQSVILRFDAPVRTTNVNEIITIEREIISSQVRNIFFKTPDQQTFALGSLEYDNAFNTGEENLDSYQNYNDLTSSLSNLDVIGGILSGSHYNYPNLNTDYNKFKNHIFFGSAVSKLKNFKAKLDVIQGHYNDISASLTATGVTASYNSSTGLSDSYNLVKYRENLFTKIQQKINTFTPYEEFLYYDGQSQTTASAPGLGKNYAHGSRGAIKGKSGNNQHDLTTYFPSQDGFKSVFRMIHSASAGGEPSATGDVFRNTYRAEQKPFFNYSGSVYLSFLIKGDSGSYDDDDNFAGGGSKYRLSHFYGWHQQGEMGDYDTPKDSVYKSWIQRPIIRDDEWHRYIIQASASYWIPNADIGYDTAGTDGDGVGLNPESTVADGGNYIVITSSLGQKGLPQDNFYYGGEAYSASIKAHAVYSNLATQLTQSGTPFTGSISPSGDYYFVRMEKGNFMSSSFITDVKVTTKDPTNVYPFSQIYISGSTEWSDWYDRQYQSAKDFDEDNIHSLFNNLPEYLRNRNDTKDLKTFLSMTGEHFDLIRNHIDSLGTIKKRNYDKTKSVPNNLLPIILGNMGWDAIQPFSSSLDQYFGSTLSSVTNTETVESNTWRKTLNNLIYLYKSKGTLNSVRALLNIYGYPPDVLGISEYGGSSEEHNPSIITNEIKAMNDGLERKQGNISFTKQKKKLYHYRFANDSNRILNYDWWVNNANVETIEFVYKHIKSYSTGSTTNKQEILKSSGSAKQTLWDLRVVPKQLTSSLSKFEFRLSFNQTGSNTGDDIAASALSMSTDYVNMGEGQLWNVMLQRMTSSISGSGTNEYKLYTALQDKDKITSFNAVSMSVSGGLVNSYVTGGLDTNYHANQNWQSSGSRHYSSGSNLFVGRTLSGSLAEFRTWDVSLSASKFKQHTLNKFSVVGDNLNAHKDNLIYHYRLNENWYSGSSAERKIFDGNPKGPKSNPTKYDIDIPSAIGTGSRVYGFDLIDVYSFTLRTGAGGQKNNNNITINSHRELVGNLRHDKSSTLSVYSNQSKKQRQTSTKLEIQSSPQNFVDDFIVNNIADYNLEDKFGNPSDLYNPNYSELENFTKEFFENYDIIIDNNKFIRSNENLYNQSILRAVNDMIPARSTLSDESVGVTIKPTILEKQKIKHHKLSLDYGSPGINGLKEIIDVPSYIDFGPKIETSKDAEFEIDLKTDANLLKIKNTNITIKNKVESSFEKEKNVKIEIKNLISSSFEDSMNVDLQPIDFTLSSSFDKPFHSNLLIIDESSTTAETSAPVNADLLLISSQSSNLSSSLDLPKESEINIDQKIDSSFEELKIGNIDEEMRVESKMIVAITGSNDFINTNYTKEFRNLHDEWGLGDDKTHFINPYHSGSDGKYNTSHIEDRFVFKMIGDVEVVSGSRVQGAYTIDFTNIKDTFYNRQIVDKGNRLGFKYNSYMRSDLDEQDGRAMGRTSYFYTASDGYINYPVNHYINFQHNYVNQMHRGTQNTNPGILNGQEWEDFSTASFYTIKVTNTDNILRVER
mgnify:CR=1 FL=1|tara:strand:+ start:5401 stop:10605 length:5205 start_codon:yes stop_codon:yes gene_type:complete